VLPDADGEFLIANTLIFGVLSVALSLRAQEKGKQIIDGVLLFWYSLSPHRPPTPKVKSSPSRLSSRQCCQMLMARMLASLGGYLAPLLLSTGGGSFVALFSFYLLLSIGSNSLQAGTHLAPTGRPRQR
jgi:hypothetical protein